ncbi:hypothetical protein [Variovorax sp. GT1P44]|uniref:hypothetical protein n=1 Tax=Variovorax sp. GT1P44 TaxID=3443742 RepID=UPI003F447F1A
MVETLQQARSAITLRRQDYDDISPHSSCQQMPPASSPSCIASALAMQLDPSQTPPRSIDLATLGLPRYEWHCKRVQVKYVAHLSAIARVQADSKFSSSTERC